MSDECLMKQEFGFPFYIVYQAVMRKFTLAAKSIFFRTAYRPATKPLLLTFFTSLLSSRTLQSPFNPHSTTIQGVLPDLLAKTHSLLSNSFLLDLRSSLPNLVTFHFLFF